MISRRQEGFAMPQQRPTERFRRPSLVFCMLVAASWPASSQATGGGTGQPPYGTAAGGGQITISPSGGRSSSGTAPGVTTQGPFQGSVPTGKATGTSLALTLKDAVDRALKYNLGVIQSDQNTRSARAERLRYLSALLPTLYGQLTGSV